jgi:hypothetical protein
MLKSLLLKAPKAVILFLIILAASISYCFGPGMGDQDWLGWVNKCLMQSFDPSSEIKLKKWELTLTDDSFIRLRKTYQSGKQEYYSFQLRRLDDINYLGTGNTGTLQLRAKADDIIVQTYNDRDGNVDSMANILSIPVKDMAPERLDSLRSALNYFKEKGL